MTTTEFTIEVEAELTGHNRKHVWFRVAASDVSYKVLTYPADIVEFKPGEFPKGSRFTIFTDDAGFYSNGHGWRFKGGIGSVIFLSKPEVTEDNDE